MKIATNSLSLGLRWLFLASFFVMLAIATNSTASASNWEKKYECEYPDDYTVGTMISRSNASGQKVHGEFGCENTSGYPPKSGYVKYNNFYTPQIDKAYLTVRYSKNSASSVPIDVYLDNELRSSFLPENTGDWNQFNIIDNISLGSVSKGIHSLKISTIGQQWGIADLDYFKISGEYIGTQSIELLFLPAFINGITNNYKNWAANRSGVTTCAEDDNVNIPIYARQINRFKVVATNPNYDMAGGSCDADFSGCSTSNLKVKNNEADSCTKLLDDGSTIINGCITNNWWRPYDMNIVTGNGSGSFHYVTINRKIDNANSWPQVLVIYEDGNMRMKPHPPSGVADTCFGSSLIIGPAIPSSRPYIDIKQIRFNSSDFSIDITFRDNSTAHVDLAVNRSRFEALVNVNYFSGNNNIPFVTFRSMYVDEINSDASRIEADKGAFPIMTGWSRVEGPWWFFGRKVHSNHNTSAPDIKIEVID